jgi:hypothetical protein
MTDSNVFRIWGAIYAWATFLLWIYIAVRSLWIQIRVELGYFRHPSHSLDVEKGTEKVLDQSSEEMEAEAKIQAEEGNGPLALTK